LFWRRKKAEPAAGKIPPGQSPIPGILRWGIDHPGITHILPNVPRDSWSLVVDGEVEKPLKFSWAEFLALPQADSVSDFHCVEGWSVLAQRWRGVLFSTIKEQAKPKPSVEYALFECADGYTTSLPIKELKGNDIVLAHSLNGEDLSQPLGGPMRLVVPQKYAYKSPMWVIRIIFATHDTPGFWERGYYSNTADIWKDDRYRPDA
jgi:DMSO/TMAO reductase YedYZ molybdopterin-dependent catalytic subunit